MNRSSNSNGIKTVIFKNPQKTKIQGWIATQVNSIKYLEKS